MVALLGTALVVMAIAASVAARHTPAVPCDLYLAPSTIPGRLQCPSPATRSYSEPCVLLSSGIGFGLFTGRGLNAGDVIDSSFAVQVVAGKLFGTQLHSFSFRSDHGPSEIPFGSAMFMNHAEEPNVKVQLLAAGERRSEAVAVALGPISAGAELFVDYGQSWFASRNITVGSHSVGASAYDQASVPDLVCLSHVRIAESSFRTGGRGVFSTAETKKGAIINVSPVLILPKKRFIRSELSGFLLSEPAADMAVLPLGAAALANHGGAGATAAVCWFYPAEGACGGMPDLLKGGSLSKNDLILGHVAEHWVAYVATRDIRAGEEVTLDYGDAFNERGENEALLRGGNEFESTSSPIIVQNLFSKEFRNAPYADTFRVDALRALTGIDTAALREALNSRIKKEL